MIKNSLANVDVARDMGSIPGLGRSREIGNGNLLQYSDLENSVDRGSWWAIVHGASESRTRLNDYMNWSLKYR